MYSKKFNNFENLNNLKIVGLIILKTLGYFWNKYRYYERCLKKIQKMIKNFQV
jgi:hypothetical protein